MPMDGDSSDSAGGDAEVFVVMLAITCSLLSVVPSVWRLYQTKSSCDVSRLSIVFSLLGAVFFLIYGLLKRFTVAIIHASVTVFVMLVFLAFTLHYHVPNAICAHRTRHWESLWGASSTTS